jgi:hypothetical protein
MILLFAGGPGAMAASISWTTFTVSGSSDVNANGTLAGAINVGQNAAPTVNGVTFVGEPGGVNTALSLGPATVAFNFGQKRQP